MRRSELKRSTKPMKRTALKRGASILKRIGIVRRKTKRLRDYEAELERMRPIVMTRSRGQCEADRIVAKYPKPTGAVARLVIDPALHSFRGVKCSGFLQVHHRKYRARGGTNGIDNLALVCGSHHDWAHSHGGYGEPANLLGLALTVNESEAL